MGSRLRGGDCHANSCNRHRHARCDRDRPHRRDQRLHLDRDQGGDGRIAAALRARQRSHHSRELCPFRRADPRFDRGEPVDVFLTDSAAIDELIKQGKVVGGRTDVARTGIGIAVRKGAPKPDVSSPEALRRALLAAKSIAHTAPAGGGVTAAHVMGVFAKLGIAAEVAPKVKLAAGGPNGRVSVLVSSGEAEIGLQQVSELMSNPEVEVIGMLPAELQQTTTYSAGATTSARDADAARALIRALTAPSAAAIYKAKGLDPAW